MNKITHALTKNVQFDLRLAIFRLACWHNPTNNNREEKKRNNFNRKKEEEKNDKIKNPKERQESKGNVLLSHLSRAHTTIKQKRT